MYSFPEVDWSQVGLAIWQVCMCVSESEWVTERVRVFSEVDWSRVGLAILQVCVRESVCAKEGFV